MTARSTILPMKELAHEFGLQPGETVEVRELTEILDTLQPDGTLDGLPFMPEMIPFCGHRFRVFRRAHKTCDTISWSGLRGMDRAVHLEDLRCDGSAHGGCQAGCLFFWRKRGYGVYPATSRFASTVRPRSGPALSKLTASGGCATPATPHRPTVPSVFAARPPNY